MKRVALKGKQTVNQQTEVSDEDETMAVKSPSSRGLVYFIVTTSMWWKPILMCARNIISRAHSHTLNLVRTIAGG